MGGITTGIGIFSGIDTRSLIEQLLNIEARPRLLAQRRLFQLKTQQAAYLDLNSRMQALKTAAASFRIDNTFNTRLANSSDEAIMTAIAGTSAINGSFTFIVDRLVSTQQLLSRGFANLDSTALGIDNITLEGWEGRLDRDVALSDLNSGSGINRGTLVIDGVEIDMSRVGTVQDVLDAINDNTSLSVTARVSGGSFVLEGATSVASGPGTTIAEDLGLAGKSPSGGRITGDSVYGLNDNVALASLNDGRGVDMTRTIAQIGRYDFTIDINGVTVQVNIGDIWESSLDDDGEEVIEVIESAPSTIAGVIDRINQAIADKATELGQPDLTNVVASIDSVAGGLVIQDSLGRTITVAEHDDGGSADADTAADLGIVGTSATGLINGTRILAGLNSTLTAGLNGGSGIGGDGMLTFDTADGASFTVDVSSATTMSELIDLINDDSNNAGRVVVSLSAVGTGLQASDTTSGGNDFVISGTGGDDTATTLGLAGTYTDGLAAGSSLQLAYLSQATLVADLNNGKGIGTGSFEIIGTNGGLATIKINKEDTTLGHIIAAINARADDVGVQARMNSTGDGIELYEMDPGSPGATKIKVTDVGGSVASALKIEGEATGTGADNFIDGSYETRITFDPTDTLQDVVRKINEAGGGVAASIINDGIGSSPYRLSLSSKETGTGGRFTIDSFGFDLGLKTLDTGNDARVFFGSANAADGVLLSSSSNTLDSVIQGVTIDLKSTSDGPVELTITTDTESIETKVAVFVDAFNTVLSRIDEQSRFIADTGERGPLLGDGTALNLRQSLFRSALQKNDGFSSAFDRLVEVGITVGAGGKLVFDREKFREALEKDPDAVEAMFTTRDIDPDGGGNNDLPDGIEVNDPFAETVFSALGVINQIEEFADDYINSIDGVFKTRRDALGAQITLQEDRIEQMTQRLESRRGVLQRQFLAMEKAIASLQTQQAALGQISYIG